MGTTLPVRVKTGRPLSGGEGWVSQPVYTQPLIRLDSLILRHLRNGRPILFFVTINTLWDVWLGRWMTRCCLRVQNTLSRCGTQE